MLRRSMFAAALLAALMVTGSPVLADQVRELLPGGHSSLSPNTDGPDGTRQGGHGDTGAAQGTGSSHGQSDGDLGLQARQFAAGADLGCAVPDGSAPRDLNVTNLADYTLPAGTRIKWQVGASGPAGFFALINALPAGQQLVAEGILPPGATPGGACTARVI